MTRKEKCDKLSKVFNDDDFLSECLNITPSEMRNLNFTKEQKILPEVLYRIDFLYRIVIALDGIYTNLGIYRWFHRKRTQLGDKAPNDILAGDWRPEDEYPQKVLELAEWLLYGTIAT